MAGNTRAIANQMVTRKYFRQFVVDQSAEPRYPRRIKDWWWNCDKNSQEMRIETPPLAARLRAKIVQVRSGCVRGWWQLCIS